LSTHLKEKTEKVEEILERLAVQSSKGIPIIVEGRKDVETLRRLAFNGNIIAAKTRKSFLALAAEIEHLDSEEVVLLLDFDRRGKEWTRRLTQYLERSPVKPNTFFWNELQSLVSNDVKDVEGILAYLVTLRNKTGESQTIIESKL
jgi:2,5-diamino-6-(ribosylamino)-4(3H)-pyrimidinone 5'-phosphate reductase